MAETTFTLFMIHWRCEARTWRHLELEHQTINKLQCSVSIKRIGWERYNQVIPADISICSVCIVGVVEHFYIFILFHYFINHYRPSLLRHCPPQNLFHALLLSSPRLPLAATTDTTSVWVLCVSNCGNQATFAVVEGFYATSIRATVAAEPLTHSVATMTITNYAMMMTLIPFIISDLSL